MSQVTLLLLFAWISVSFAQTDDGKVQAMISDGVKAWNQGDLEGFLKTYWKSDKTVFNTGGTLVQGYTNIQAQYKTWYPSPSGMGTTEFTDIVLRDIAPTAKVAMGVWKVLLPSKIILKGRFTWIIGKKSEGWRITHDHTSSQGN